MSARAVVESPPALEARPAPPWSGWVLAAAAVLAAFLIAGLLAEGLSPTPGGPPSSSYATAPNGVAAWAELLGRSGHPVTQLRADLGGAALDPGSTLVVLGARGLEPSAARNLAAFVSAGGRLVTATGSRGRVLPGLISDPPVAVRPSPRRFQALVSGPETDGVQTVETAGAGAWRGGTGERALGAGPSATLLLVRPRGRGRVDLLADASPVQNRLLAAADNARFALDLAGPPGRPVVFAEALHGYGAATGIAALPMAFWVAFAGLCLAGAAWALARGRRLGPPEAPRAVGQPPRSAYVEALAGTLTRSRDITGLTRLTRGHIASELDRRLARRPGAAEVPRREALMALGVSEQAADLALAPASSDEGEAGLLVLGRVLARLRSER
jgi:hypothetical protein